jgi:hypothetical protein
LAGFSRIFAVSAMKWTPAEDDHLGVDVDGLLGQRQRVADVMSATPWKISGVW